MSSSTCPYTSELIHTPRLVVKKIFNTKKKKTLQTSDLFYGREQKKQKAIKKKKRLVVSREGFEHSGREEKKIKGGTAKSWGP